MGRMTTPPSTSPICSSVMAESLAAKSTVRAMNDFTPAPLPVDW